MICAKCGVDYSDSVFPHHVSRCPGNRPVEYVAEESKEDNDVQEQKQEEKTQVKRSRGKR